MDYEKKYKEALTRATKLHSEPTGGTERIVCEQIFPELRESEDEKIRKVLIDYFKIYKEQEECSIKTFYGIPTDDILAWLEKQSDKDELIKELGEYKAKYTQEVLEKHLRVMNKDDERLRKTTISFLKDFADKGYENAVECIDWLEKQGEQKQETNYPKFDYDDILALQCCMKNAEKVTEDKELYEKLKSLHSRLHDAYWIEKQGTQPRYNIGDILCDKLCTTLNKDAQPNMEIVDIKNGMYICDKGSFPVSQQDEYELVGKKIDTKLNDDSVSNELRAASSAHAKKEILNPTFPNNEEFELAYMFEKGAKWDAAQKPTWSEKHISDVFEKVGLAKIVREQSNDALTIALQDAMIELSKVTLQPKHTAWSEEDEEILRTIISDGIRGAEFDMLQIDWLKSIKNRYAWKPSDEQMAALNNAILLNEDHYNGAVLSTLREQLMKLK